MNHEQDEITVARAGEPKDFGSVDRDAVDAYRDHQDRQDAAEYDTKDSRDYAKDDQETADTFLRHFGLPDSKSVRQRVEEDREARAKAKEDAGYTPIPTNFLWMVGGDGTPFVRLEQDLLAGDYTIEDIEALIARLSGAVEMAKRMSHLRPWLEKNGVEPDMVIKLLLAAAKDTDQQASKEALLALGGIFGRSW